MAKESPGVKIERLRNLEPFPDARTDYALRLLASERHPEVMQAALDALAASDDPRVRLALLERYAAVEQDPTHRDSGCYQRVALIRTLRHLARRDDTVLLERAVTTYEFIPPGKPEDTEVAAGLRSVALVTLNEVDETLAGYHAVRLLWDRFTSRMSGEPAVTAAQVLASQGHELLLYAYLLSDGAKIPEVVAECLRQSTAISDSLLRPLIPRELDDESEIVLLGLFDLLLARAVGPSYDDVIEDFLRETRLINMYRYLANMIVATRREGLMSRLAALAAEERDPAKAEILREALALR